MLDLYRKLAKNKAINKHKVIFINKTPKHFPSPVREWNNSIYVYNKNSINLIPSLTISATKIIKSYFNLYNKSLESKVRTKRLLLRFRRFSSNKYYVSNGEYKHTNNKVLINLYVFNRQKMNYLLILKKWYLNQFLMKNTTKRNININIINRLNLINKKGLEAVKTLNQDKLLLIKALNNVLNNKNLNLYNFKDLSQYTQKFYQILLTKSFKRVRMYFYYKQLLYINKSKLNYTYLQYLKKNLEKIYAKNIEFNILNLKRFYLNSDILSESITNKLARKRRKLLKYITNLKNKVSYLEWKKKNLVKKNTKLVYDLSTNKLLLQNYIFFNLKYKHVSGFRLQAKGRLNKRFTASRSISKLKYKGNLLNIDSSYKGLSSVLLKGNLRSNVQYTQLASKSRIGSFGIKGWVSGY